MILDMELGTLAFAAEGKYLGVVHSGLRGKTVFPTVSSVWGHCEVSFVEGFIFSLHLMILGDDEVFDRPRTGPNQSLGLVSAEY